MSQTTDRPAKMLHHVIAKEKTAKADASVALTNAYHIMQKPALFTGLSKTYTPFDDEGEKLPSDLQRIQVHAENLIKGVEDKLTAFFNVTAQKDWANCRAHADIVVEGKVLLANVPATYLLFLEKQLTDLHTFIKKLPTHDPSEKWEWDASQGYYVSGVRETNRTKKVMRNHVLAPATDKHPAQVQAYSEDTPIGRYFQVNFTGALPVPRVEELLRRVDTLRMAVKDARQTANATAVEEVEAGKPILEYLFGA